MNLKEDFVRHLQQKYPGLKNEPLDELIADQLLSPHNIELPQTVLEQAQNFIEKIFSVRQLPSYAQHLESNLSHAGIQDPGNKSIMMSYDFHLDENQNLKLIEINTNAAFLGLGLEMYKLRDVALPVPGYSHESLRDCIFEELQLNGHVSTSPLRTVIIDEEPAQQKLYAEFLLFNELFKSWGWNSSIADFRQVPFTDQPDFIYNRHTDFFLSSPESLPLREAFLNKTVCLSPNPYEYILLADKNRLIEWSRPDFFESLGVEKSVADSLRLHLPFSSELNRDTMNDIWSKRKNLFFKPKNAFGSKQSYRGASISRKAFEELAQSETLAQEYIPAPERELETPEGPQKFKFDLRCYVYQSRLQLVLARIYQGQVTNLRTPGGGFACVTFRPVQ